ncbi:alpha-hydroxy-acid oxidizing enzyme [Microbulbifer sp. A4B17]|uniref:alpha-hydroxy acid oxidase n=1 Tax=Microbulbifer sp. A4B17 TaxID=359370 RepID=UPI000D52E0D3|nr:alpha-hydroxy acid oxidase [Microbulbifer sp. A4B17]AWF81693.1 alpha-hydroxy-acid oxidizing enzyme [Microbulbifer sp. A4B17]
MTEYNNLFNRHFASSERLRKRAKQKIPKFSYEYLIEGCMDDIGLHRNRLAFNSIKFTPEYIRPNLTPDLSCSLFGSPYSAPFGMAPIGLQGLMWPNAPVILAKAAYKHNIPFILSTVSSESLERISEVSNGTAWYQLYNPTESAILSDLLSRLNSAQYKHLVITIDVPTFGLRPRDFHNGLAMPPKLTVKNIWQAILRPHWSLSTIKYGLPRFKNLESYTGTKNKKLELTEFMNTTTMGPLDFDSLMSIRNKWPHKLIIKGITNELDLQKAIKLGADGVILSNHGARQLDLGEATLPLLTRFSSYQEKIPITIDSGIRSGADIAGAYGLGAKFSFLGRFFMFSVCALGEEGADHAIYLLKAQLTQVMQQIGAKTIKDLHGKVTLSN